MLSGFKAAISAFQVEGYAVVAFVRHAADLIFKASGIAQGAQTVQILAQSALVDVVARLGAASSRFLIAGLFEIKQLKRRLDPGDVRNPLAVPDARSFV